MWLAQLFIHFIYFFNWLFLFQAITGLNGMQLGEKKLIVQRASVGAKTNMNNVSKSLCQAGLEKITLLKQFCFFQIFWSPEFKPILKLIANLDQIFWSWFVELFGTVVLRPRAIRHCVSTPSKKKPFVIASEHFLSHFYRGWWSKAVLYLKLKGAQCSEPVKSRVPSIMICMKNLRFSSRPRAKVRRQEPPGSARAQPWWRNAAEGLIHVHFCHGLNKHLSHSFTRHKIQHLLCFIAHNHIWTFWS